MCLINFPLQLKIIVGACFLYRRAIIYFFGWHAISKAVELSGSNVGGCGLVVKALPVPKTVPSKTTSHGLGGGLFFS